MRYLLISFCLLLLSCNSADLADVPWVLEDETHEGFLKVRSAGKSVFVGTEDSLALASEKPRMEVKFTYDFSMQEHEVTQGEFALLLKGNDDVDEKNLPVANVTYYDAVLYANALSKKEHLDTVYTYVGLSRDATGNCSNLDGLVFHPDVEGYRLPT